MKLLPRMFRQSKDPADTVVSQRLEESIECAGYWARRMPWEAARLVRKVRFYTLAAAVLSLVTGVLAWPVIGESSQLAAQVFISVLSGIAALVVVVPHVTGLSDRGDESIRLCATYGAVYRELLEARGRLAAGSLEDPAHVAEIIRQFEHIQERRDALALPAGDGYLEGGSGVGAVRGGGQWGRAGLGGPQEIAGPLLPSARGGPQDDQVVAVDDEAVLAALVCVLRSGYQPRRVPSYARVSSAVVHRLFRVWPRAGGWGAPSPGGVGRIRRLRSAGSLTSRPRLGPGARRGGGELAGPGPTVGDRPGSGVQLVRDAAGMPVVLGASTGADRHARS
ncbi:hypothetical protein ACFU6I_14515 [Streptomyces sp. NPDC057486]|uniref:hypothetical protein n=1 Tax=Streptomyces sp. NPDC057486 TaxID=3346145 RepID=UPI00367B0AF7